MICSSPWHTRGWRAHQDAWTGCVACPLHESRSRVVLGRGRLPCDILLVGEAPGMSENTLGRPFVGPAGRLLDEMLAEVLQRVQFNFAITNVVACLPLTDQRDLRKPTREEAAACAPRFQEFLKLAKPKGVVLMGQTARVLAVRSLPQKSGRIAFCEVVHPAYILRKGGRSAITDYKRWIMTVAQFAQETLHGKTPS